MSQDATHLAHMLLQYAQSLILTECKQKCSSTSLFVWYWITVQHHSINQNNYSYAGILLLKEDYQCCHQISFRYIDCILPTTKVFHRVKPTRALNICLLPRVKGGYASIAQYVVSPANPPR